MNWIDYFILIFLLFFAIEGLKRSFLGEFLDFLAFLLAFFFSLRFYNLLGSFFSDQFSLPHSISSVLGFILVWFLVEAVLFSLAHILIAKLKYLHRLDRHLSPLAIIPAILRGLIFVAILLVLLGTFPIQPEIKKAVSYSKLGLAILDRSQRLEGPLKQVFGGISQDTLTFLTIKPKSDESINLGFQTIEFSANTSLEDKMIELVNKERANSGLRSLKFDGKLREVARVHSADMFKRGYFSHYSIEGEDIADRVEKIGVNYLVIGENLAYAPNLDLAHKGLMNSLGHRANILSSEYGKIGIGVQDGGVYGLMITQVFSN